MKINLKIALLAINTVLCVLIILAAAFLMSGWGALVKAVFYGIAGAGLLFGAVVFILKRDALFKTCFVLVVCAFAVTAVIALISTLAHLNEYATDEERITRLKEIIEGTGGWGMLIYVIVQVLQVIILPLPAAVCYIPGSLIWGPLISTLLASLGVLIGSVAAYLLGRFFGKRVVVWIAGKEACEKYSRIIGSKGKVIFVLMQILPFFPDDILCMVAGMTSMNFPFFLITMIVVRPFVIAAYCYLGSGTVIPFNGWGIPVWIAVFAVCIALAVLSFKYQERFESWLVSKFKKSPEEDSGTKSEEEAQTSENKGEDN